MHAFGFFLFPMFFPFVFPFFGFGFVLYFLPTIVAALREKHDKVSIFLLNFLLGWSLIGWIVALVWACKEDRVIYVQNPQRY
ncbi:MAG: superinfection immunity protein [Terriglobales bacterium]